MSDDFRKDEQDFVKKYVASNNRVKASMAQMVHLANTDDDFKCIESMRGHYAQLLESKASQLRGNGEQNLARVIEQASALLGVFSLDGPLATRIMTESNRRASRDKYECFEAYYRDLAETVVDHFPSGSHKSLVFNRFIESADLDYDDKSHSFAKRLLSETEKRYMKKFKGGRPSKNLDVTFERAVLERVVHQPKDGYTEIRNHVKEVQPRPYQGRLSDTEIESKVKSVFNKYQLQSREKREEFSLKKSSFS